MSSATAFTDFARLHEGPETFILANAWDPGSARWLAALGVKALATTSAGYAFSRGQVDWVGEMSRAEALAHAEELVGATALPVSADLEDGFGASPEDVAETIRQAGAAGLAGCTIEDTTGDHDQPIHDFDLAVARIEAAVAAARDLGRPFLLTARSENFLHGRPDLDDTLKRLQAYQEVGADVLYAPGLPDLEAVATVCRETDRPVNVVAGIGLPGVTVNQLAEAGVRRISLGSVLARTAIGAAITAARSVLETGRLNDAFAPAAGFAEIQALITRAPR